jgi:hypothetical protein
MGWSVSLVYTGGQKDGVAQVDPHFGGSNICVGGQTEASMTVTYNYSPILRAIYDAGFEDTFNNVLGCESEYLFVRGITLCNDIPFKRLAQYYADETKRRSKDSPFGEVDGYWLCTAENVAAILGLMLSWAKQHPMAKWQINP